MKRIIDRVNSPTPKWAKRIGQALAAAGASILVVEFISGFELWTNIAVGSTFVGSFLMALFKE